MQQGFNIKKIYLFVFISCCVLFLWFVTIFAYTDPNIALQGVYVKNHLFKIDGFSNNFANFNRDMFGYLAYVYLPLLLIPIYRFHDDMSYSFRKIKLTFAYLLLFVSLLVVQSIIFNSGTLGNLIRDLLHPYIGIFGVFFLSFIGIILSLVTISEKMITFIIQYFGGTLSMLGKSLKKSIKKGIEKIKMIYVDFNLDYLQRANKRMLHLEYSEIVTMPRSKYTFDESLIEPPLDEYIKTTPLLQENQHIQNQSNHTHINENDVSHKPQNTNTQEQYKQIDDAHTDSLCNVKSPESTKSQGVISQQNQVSRITSNQQLSSQYIDDTNKQDFTYLQHDYTAYFSHTPHTQIQTTNDDEDVLKRFQKANAHIKISQPTQPISAVNNHEHTALRFKLTEELPNPLQTFIKEKPNVQDSWLLQDSKLQAATQPKTIDTTQPQDSIIREISKSNNTISTNTLDIPRNDSLDSKEITPDTQNSSIYSHITQAQYDIATIQQKQPYNTLQQHNTMITSNKTTPSEDNLRKNHTTISMQQSDSIQNISSMPLHSTYKTMDMNFTKNTTTQQAQPNNTMLTTLQQESKKSQESLISYHFEDDLQNSCILHVEQEMPPQEILDTATLSHNTSNSEESREKNNPDNTQNMLSNDTSSSTNTNEPQNIYKTFHHINTDTTLTQKNIEKNLSTNDTKNDNAHTDKETEIVFSMPNDYLLTENNDWQDSDISLLQSHATQIDNIMPIELTEITAEINTNTSPSFINNISQQYNTMSTPQYPSLLENPTISPNISTPSQYTSHVATYHIPLYDVQTNHKDTTLSNFTTLNKDTTPETVTTSSQSIVDNIESIPLETQQDTTPSNHATVSDTYQDIMPSDNNAVYILPSTNLLQHSQIQENIEDQEIDSKIENLLAKLKVFKIKGDIVHVFTGPVVTTFEFRPEPDVKVNKVLGLQDDLAMALKAKSIRIQAPIPGKDVMGIEIPNNKVATIFLREILESSCFKEAQDALTIILGKDIMGEPLIVNLAQLPHLLVAGTTGSGKSVGVNAIILSLLYRNNPDDLKLMMIDPKQVEFAPYEDLPHLITPIINSPSKAIQALQAATIEMDKRYKILSEAKTKSIVSYNEKSDTKMPFFVIIIDELADLIMTGGKDAEVPIARIAQMGRAAGMHLIIATQRSSTNIVTGTIKANLPSRISYRVGNRIDSKVILDDSGAERLLGNGDGLFASPQGLRRIHAPWVSEKEIENVVDFIKQQKQPQYDESFLNENKSDWNIVNKSSGEGGLLEEAKTIILRDNKTSISYLQRKLGIGYNKAASLIESLENEGFLSAPNSKGERSIIG